MLGADKARGMEPPEDDIVLPFRTVRSDVIGRIIRLGPVVDTVLSRHAYPEPVSHALGEALALTAMLGTALKVEAKLILQTKTDGALDLLVADFVAPGKVRGYASFDKADSALAADQGPRRSGPAARQGPHGHDHRSRRRQGPLPGDRRAGRRAAGRGGTHLLPPVGAAADLHPPGRGASLRSRPAAKRPAQSGTGAPAD